MRKTRRLPLEALSPAILETGQPVGPPTGPSSLPPLNWVEVFGNPHPVELEVGFGKGLFLLKAARADPATNFVGIEIVRKYHLLAATRIIVAGLSNVRLACGDALWLLRERVEAGSLRRIHVYFPDPWWKKRHQKRRLVTPTFVALCARALNDSGELRLATDVSEYFELMQETMTQSSGWQGGPLSDADDTEPLTHFERKYRQQGRPIYRAQYTRVSREPALRAGRLG